jgi:hypothetical protein
MKRRTVKGWRYFGLSSGVGASKSLITFRW